VRILLTADPEIPVPPVQYGGIERIIDTLARSYQKNGHEVGLVAHPDSTVPVDTFFAWPGRRSQNFFDLARNIWALDRAIKKFRPDILHSFSRIFYMAPHLCSRLPKIMSYQRPPTARTVRLATRIAGDRLVFTGCGEHICRQGRAFGGQWHAIHNFVDIDKFTFQPTVAEDAPLVFLGRIERIKGAHTAIEVAKRTGKRLLIAGNHYDEGEAGIYWRDAISPELGKNGIEYVGPVDDVQKNRLLGSAAAMIVPIEWEEPFGIVFAESLSCGTPVISTPRGALPEIVRQGVDGYLDGSTDGLCKAVGQLGQIVRENCRKRVEESFSSHVIVDKYLGLYRSLRHVRD
jgi:glycosyltransferase involved in cell wall biosynthesis